MTCPAGAQSLGIDTVLLSGAASHDLVRLAVRAVDAVTGPDSWWRNSWTSEADLAAADEAIAQLRSVLEG